MTKARVYNSELINELIEGTSPEELAKTEKRMLLAARLDDAIKARGWKQTDFAKAIGKKPSEVSRWLSGAHNFTSDTLFDIEHVLEINIVKVENIKETIVRTYNVSVSMVAPVILKADYKQSQRVDSLQYFIKANSLIHSTN
jgi:transcriptional regulator with XRE-family HTH domain